MILSDLKNNFTYLVGCNNVIASLLRQYGVENVLYIGMSNFILFSRPSPKIKSY